jgi:hypothetical protein
VYVCIKNTLFTFSFSMEVIAVYCENHTEDTNTLCGKNADVSNVKACGTVLYVEHFRCGEFSSSHPAHSEPLAASSRSGACLELTKIRVASGLASDYVVVHFF